jgi:phage baseplate assembly protein V
MSDPFDVLSELADAYAHLRMELAEIRYAMDRTLRHGKVTDVDTKKQLARIEIGEKDGTPVKSAWLPYAQFAGPDGGGEGKGEYKFHNPPFKGQQLTLFAPNGEIRQGVLLPFTWSNTAKSPSDKPDEAVITYGKLKIERTKELHRTTVDQTSIEQTKDTITLKASKSIKLQVGEADIEVTPDKIIVFAKQVSVAKLTYTGQAERGFTEQDAKVATIAGPAKQHWSKP